MKLKRRIISDAANVSATNMVVAGTQLLETIILARMLIPEEMGLVAVVAVILGFVRSIADLGVSNALIHFQNTSRTVFSSLTVMLMAFGGLIFCAFYFGRPFFSLFLHDSPLVGLTGWIGLVFLVSPAGFLYQFFLQKEMRFRRIKFVESSARCLGTATVIVIAVNHGGVFSYVAGQVVYSGVKSALLLAVSYRMMPLSFAFSFSPLRPYLKFGMFQMGERVVNFFASNVDYIIIGRFLGTRELGFYKIAFELVTAPQRLINPIFTAVALPRFAKNQHNDAALREGVLLVLRALAFVTFPLLFGLAATAPVLIPVVYGTGWEQTVPLLWLLAAMGIFKVIGNIGSAVIVAKGRVKTGFIWNCIIASCNTVAFLVAVRYGTGTVAAVYSALLLTYLVLSFRSYYGDTIGLSFFTYIRSFSLPGLLSVVMGGAVFGVYLALDTANMRPFVELLVLVSSGSAVYGLLSVSFIKRELAGLFSGFRGDGAPASVSLDGDRASGVL